MRGFDRDLIRGEHYGQRSCEPHKRPNTWLHRPACGREESPCQLGAVHTWHSAVPTVLSNVGFRGQTGKHLLTSRLTGFDPQQSWCCWDSPNGEVSMRSLD